MQPPIRYLLSFQIVQACTVPLGPLPHTVPVAHPETPIKCHHFQFIAGDQECSAWFRTCMKKVQPTPS